MGGKLLQHHAMALDEALEQRASAFGGDKSLRVMNGKFTGAELLGDELQTRERDAEALGGHL